MFQRINNLHLSVLVGIVSIFSLLLIQQYVEAQTWVDPSDLPGQTPDNTFIVNPLADTLDIGTNDQNIEGDNVILDGGGAGAALTVDGGRKICLGGTSDAQCKDAWPVISGGVIGAGTERYFPIFTTDGSPYISTTTVEESAVMFEHASQINIGKDGGGGSLLIKNQGGSYPGLRIWTDQNFSEDGLNILNYSVNGRPAYIMQGNSSNNEEALFIHNKGLGASLYINDATNVGDSSDNTPFVVDAEGEVGISSSTPSHNLDIRSANNKSAEIALYTEDAGADHDAGHWGIYHGHSVDADGVVDYVANSPERDDLIFWHDGWNRARITGEGNLYLWGDQICDINGDNCWTIGDTGSGATSYWTEDGSYNLSRSEANVFLLASTTNALPAEASGAGARFIWYPNKYGAIRAGQLLAYTDYWDDANIGEASVAFGIDNKASGVGATVGGGYGNVASGVRATIAGGGGTAAINGNTASANVATIGGGTLNVASGYASTISGGDTNTASGYKSFIGGGYTNTASGQFSMILGGEYNKAEGDYSFAGGRGMQLTSLADHTFVWGEAPTSSPTIIAEPNQFLVFPTPPSSGPPSRFGFGTDYPLTYFHVNANDSSWAEPFVVSQDGKNTFFFIGIERWGENMGIDIGAYSNSDATYRNLTINRGAQGNVGIGVTEPTKRFMVQGDVEARGGVDFGVESINDATYNYVQLDVIEGAYPPQTDCDESSEIGRMHWTKGALHKLLICNDDGWRYVQFNTLAY